MDGAVVLRDARLYATHESPRSFQDQLTEQRVGHLQARKAAEIPVCRSQFPHPMQGAQRGDPGIVYLRTRDASCGQRGTQFRPIASRFRQEHQARSLQPTLHLSQRCLMGARRIVNLWVRDDGEELMKARPRERPGFPSLGQLAQAGIRGLMPRRVLAVNVNQYVGIDSDHAPRPW